MMIKFSRSRNGSAAAAANYLTREQLPAHDHDQDPEQEKNPEEVKVLRGHPHQVADVADGLEFEHKYTSGVIAWAPVQHREAGGGVHVHVLAARCDLATGKSLNIAAPGWQKTFDALRDWQNHEQGWSRPDDPEAGRGRATRPSGLHRGRAASGRVGGGERPPETVRLSSE